MIRLITLSVFYLLTTTGQCAPAAHSGVSSIDANNFDASVVDSANVWVLEFYSPRCGTCQEFTPLYNQLAQEYSSKYKFGSVSIDEAAGMKLAQTTDALEEGVPTVRIYTKQGDTKGQLVWAADEVPSYADLRTALLTTSAPSTKAR